MTCHQLMMLLSSKGSWDKDQHEIHRALWLAAGKWDSTLKFIVTSLFLFSAKKCPKTLLPHLSLSWLKLWPGFIQGLYKLSYCSVHKWSHVLTFYWLCGIETDGKKREGKCFNNIWAKWTSEYLHIVFQNVNHAEWLKFLFLRCQTNTYIYLE